MVLKNRISFVFIIFLFVSQNLYAVEIDIQSISKKSYYIQVGAFKSKANIQKVKDKLSKYDIYLEPYKNLQRIQVVNILTPTQLKKTLVKIRKIFPKAFVVKHPNLNQIKTKKIAEPSDDFSKSFEPSLQKEKNIQPIKPTLDSNTILKTRKSFL